MPERATMRDTPANLPTGVFTRHFVQMVATAFIRVFERRGMALPTIPDDHVLTEGELAVPYLRGKRRRKFVYGGVEVIAKIEQQPKPATTYTAHLVCGCGASNVVDTTTYPVGTTMRARCRVCGEKSEMRMGMVEIK